MNKQEVMKRIEHLGEYERFVDEPISKKSVLNILSQIDEPAKVVVPEFMDGYFRYCKDRGMSLFEAMEYAQNKEADWIAENEEVFSKAFFDGYEVEQEQLYTIEIPNNRRMFRAVLCSTSNKTVMVEIKKELEYKNFACYQLTESEIKQDFEWAWDAGFAEPVEVKEVES